MAIRTPDELQDRLDESLAWRRIEMQALKSALAQAHRQSPDAPLARALSRSCLAMLYAHWEGFGKDALQSYVDFVAKRRLRMGELNDGFIISVLAGLTQRASSGDEAAIHLLVQAVRSPDAARAQIPRNTIVNTKSNLRAAVLAEILSSVGFPPDQFSLQGNLIDRTLCDGRNSIAHGRDYYPRSEDFPGLLEEVVGMMEQLRDLVVGSAKGQLYRWQD